MSTDTNPLTSWDLGLLVYDKRNLIHVSSTTTVEEALFLLHRENILAVAVYDEGKEEFIHILTIFDLLTYVAFGCFKIDENDPDAYSIFQTCKVPVAELVSKPIHTEDERVWIFNANDKISKILEPMSKGVHRVLVDLNSGESKPLYRMLTQSDVIRFLSAYCLYSLEALDSSVPVKDLNVISHLMNVKTMHEDTKALEVFRRMHIDDVVAVPLVDDEGKLTATLSASDLRGLRSHQLRSVLLPAIKFLYVFRGPVARKCVTCTEDDSLCSVMNKFIVNKVHRVWVVNRLQQPIGVISISDVISRFVTY